MALPEGFSPPEFLQDTVMKVQNKIVREEFSDLGGDDWEPDIGAGRGALRYACTHQDTDSVDMTLTRLWLFYGVLRKAKDFHPEIFGIPSTAFKAQRKLKPQIVLQFREDWQDIDPGYPAVTGEIGFRLMNQEDETLSMAEAFAYGQRVKANFGTGGGFVWRKGKVMCSYTDWNRGYQLQLLCRDKAEGRRVIEQVLDIQQHTPDWKRMNVTGNEEPAERYPTIPPNKIIMGKSERAQRERPIADVRFRSAALYLHASSRTVVLYDPDGRSPKALID